MLGENSSPGYSRVVLPLSALLEGKFFNEYIKRGTFGGRNPDRKRLTDVVAGNLLMLSEGKAGVENAYTLKEGKYSQLKDFDHHIYVQIGILTLHLDKESYERAGLVGVPDGVKGKRGIKPWWGKCYLKA